MRLSRIKLVGFKSFVDTTSIQLPSNLVGIVGPNGCGKSNTIDAVRWVMGESSARHLRGASMDDVIFSGSSARKPVSQASVELIFDNTEGTLGGEFARYSEIAVKRQVGREGQSQYFLNGTKCRRKDIRDIFLGTGLGPRSYAIIEQGMIGRLIEAKPDEMRVHLEEAAGISKYKERRRETEQRIRRTRDNLNRLGDLAEELGAQLGRLQRQAKSAERYKSLKQEERQYKAELLALKWLDLDVKLQQRERVAEETTLAHEQAQVASQQLEDDTQAQRDQQAVAQDEVARVQGLLYQQGAEIAQIEQQIKHVHETHRQKQEELQRVEQAWASAKAHIAEDRQRSEALVELMNAQAPQLKDVEEEVSTLSQALAEVELKAQQYREQWLTVQAEQTDLQRQYDKEQVEQQALMRQQQACDSKLAEAVRELSTLDVEQCYEHYQQLDGAWQDQQDKVTQCEQQLEATRATLQQLRDDEQALIAKLDESHRSLQRIQGQVVSLEALQSASTVEQSDDFKAWLQETGVAAHPTLRQLLVVTPGWERAVDTVLSEQLHGICIDETVLRNAWDQKPVNAESDFFTPMDQGQRPQVGRLSSHLRAGFEWLPYFNRIYAVDDFAQALAQRSQLAEGESVVSRDGYWVSRDWIRSPNRTDDADTALHREQALRELRKEQQRLSDASEAQQQALDAHRRVIYKQEQFSDGLQSDAREYNQRLMTITAQRYDAEARWQRQVQQKAAFTEQQQGQFEEKEAIAEALLMVDERLSEHEYALQDMADNVAKVVAIEADNRQQMEDVQRRHDQNQAEFHRLSVAQNSYLTEYEGLQKNLSRSDQQLARLAERKEQLGLDLQVDMSPVDALQNQLQQSLSARGDIESTLNEARKHQQGVDAALRALESRRQQQDKSLTELRASLESARMAVQELVIQLRTLDEQIVESECQRETLVTSLPHDATVEAWQEKLHVIDRKLAKLGPINLAAIEEYNEQSARKSQLDQQVSDVSDALETLEQAIAKIDRETKSKFKQTFNKVNAKVAEYFPKLFGGGEASLQLTGTDLLDAGVTVMASPPGKRVTNIQLLSGGEKALTAVALVFAFFELNPAPFCLLDEVDAPLDDANVGRFCELVREMSARVQFIFITHNKLTMELSEQLMGVTMNEPGVSRIVSVDVQEAASLAGV